MDAQVFRTMIVSDSQVAQARSICSALAPTGGVGMFQVPLSADGSAPATHFVSTGHLDASFAQLMPLQEYVRDDSGAWQETQDNWSDGEPTIVSDLCAEEGLTVTPTQVAMLFAAADVTTQDPFVAFARLGLQMAGATNIE